MERSMGRKSNADQRRSEIVWALYDCLAEQGHEKVSIKAIATRAGLPPGVIHYYFKSKEDIIADLASALVDRYSQRLDLMLADARSDRQEISMAVDFVVDELIFNPSLNRVFFNLIQMAYERDRLHRVMTEMLRIYRQRFVDVLTAAGMGAQGETIASVVVALAEGFSLQWMIEPGLFSKKEVRDALIRAIGELPGA
jgi:AcrR family transcriptional regulator